MAEPQYDDKALMSAIPNPLPLTDQSSSISLLEVENRHLKETIQSLRDEMERIKHQSSEETQRAVAESSLEVRQLKATIHEVREAMDRLKADFETKLQTLTTQKRDELNELQNTIQTLRAQLEEKK